MVPAYGHGSSIGDDGDASASRGALPAQQVASCLVELVNTSKAGELASLEEVVASLMKKEVAVAPAELAIGPADKKNKTDDLVLDPEVPCCLIG